MKRASGWLALAALLSVLGVLPTVSVAQTATSNVCDRVGPVRAAIMTAAGATNCNAVDLSQVTSLNLSGKLTTIPNNQLPADSFNGLTRLTSLSLSGNDLTAFHLDLFKDLINLQSLDFRHNKFTSESLPPGVFRNLGRLTFMNPCFNDTLTTLQPGVFQGLDNLQTMFLAHNDMTSIPDNLFDDLPSLQTLQFQDNKLGTLPEDTFYGTPNLRTLVYSGAVVFFLAPPPTLPDAQAGQAITPVVLPRAIGTSSVRYSIGNLPAGLSFEAATRTLSGTPASQGAQMITYTASISSSVQRQAEIALNVQPGPLAFAAGETIPAQNYKVGEAIAALLLPEAMGGSGILVYSLTTVPEGLSFDAATRTLSGTPTAAVSGSTLTYRVTDDDNESATLTFTVDITAPLEFAAGESIPTQNYQVGEAIADLILPEATGGSGTLVYSLTNLSAGLSFDAATRTLSGTPTVAASGSTLTYRVTDGDNESATLTFAVNIQPASLAFAAGESIPAQNYQVGEAIADLVLPEAMGGSGTLVYSLTNVPTGLSFDAAARTLSGTPTAAVSGSTLTYRVTDGNSESATLTLTVNIAASPATAGTLDVCDRVEPVREAIMTAAGAANCNAVDPARVTRLNLDRALTGVADGRLPAGSFSGLTSLRELRLRNNNLTAFHLDLFKDLTSLQRLDFRHNDVTPEGLPPGVFRTLGELTFMNPCHNHTLTSLQPRVFQGLDKLQTLLLAHNDMTSIPDNLFDDLPSLTTLQFQDNNLGTLPDDTFYGTPNLRRLVYSGAAVLFLAPPPTLPDAQAGQAITPVVLPRAIGTSSVSYSIGNLPAGLSFDAATRTLSGTLQSDGSYMLTYTATSGGATRSAQIALRTEGAASEKDAAVEIATIAPRLGTSLVNALSQSISNRIAQFSGPTANQAQISADGKSLYVPLLSESEEQIGTANGAPVLGFWYQSEQIEWTETTPASSTGSEMTNQQVGISARLTVAASDFIVGVIRSDSSGDIDYRSFSADPNKYRLSLDGFSNFVNWQMDLANSPFRLGSWAAVSRNSGAMTPADGLPATDIELDSVSVGFSGAANLNWGQLQLKTEILNTDMGMTHPTARRVASDISQTRLSAAFSFDIPMGKSHRLTPQLEVGSRQLDTDTQIGTGAVNAAQDDAQEYEWALQYDNPDTNLSFLLGGRNLVVDLADGEYEEQGAWFRLQLNAGTGGRGLSFRLEPSYGDTANRIAQLWQQSPLEYAQSLNIGRDDEATKQLLAQVSYGLPMRVRGLITPYVRTHWAASGRSEMEFGSRLRLGPRFSLGWGNSLHWRSAELADLRHSFRLQLSF